MRSGFHAAHTGILSKTARLNHAGTKSTFSTLLPEPFGPANIRILGVVSLTGS
jgi:hypothetical protein